MHMCLLCQQTEQLCGMAIQHSKARALHTVQEAVLSSPQGHLQLPSLPPTTERMNMALEQPPGGGTDSEHLHPHK